MGLFDFWDDFWDDISGNTARRGQEEAVRTATGAQNAATQAQIEANDRALQAQTDMFNQGLTDQNYWRNLGMGMKFMDAQQMNNIAQFMYNQNARMQQNQLPQQTARNQMLGATPYLMSMLGIPGAMNVPQEVFMNTGQLPLNDYSAMISTAQGPGFRSGAGGVTAPTSTNPSDPNVRANIRTPGTAAATGGTPLPGGGMATPQLETLPGQYTPTAYTGNVDIQSSPLYAFQKGLLDEQIGAQAAAQGLSPEAIAYIQSKGVGRLGAEERERQVRDVSNVVQMGMGGGPMMGTQAMAPGGIGGAAPAGNANAYNQFGQTLGQSIMAGGNIYGQGLLNNAQLQANAAMNQPGNPFNQLIAGLGGTFLGGLAGPAGAAIGGKLFGSGAAPTTAPTSNPYIGGMTSLATGNWWDAGKQFLGY